MKLTAESSRVGAYREEALGGPHPFTCYSCSEKVKLGEGKKQLVLPGEFCSYRNWPQKPRGEIQCHSWRLGVLLGGLSIPVRPGLGNCWASGPDFSTKFTPQLHPWVPKHPTKHTVPLPPLKTLGKSALPAMFAFTYQLF